MAKTEIYIAKRKKGKWILFSEIPKASSGAWIFWMYLEEKYLGFLPNPVFPDNGLSRLSSLDSKEHQELWDLWKDERLSQHERLTLFTTFDKKYILKKDIPMVVEALKKVYSEMGDYSTFNKQADALLDIYENEKYAKAVVINATSVNNHIEMFGPTFNPDKLTNLMDDFLEAERLIKLSQRKVIS